MVQSRLQNASDVLGELMADADYGSLQDSGTDGQFNRFRQEVKTTRMLCNPLQPDRADDIAERLERLHASCVGNLTRFKPFIERAQAALRGE